MDKELQEILANCWADLGILCKTLFPSRFHMPYTKLHRQVIDHYNAVFRDQAIALQRGQKAGRKIVIMGNRGTSKTGFGVYGLMGRGILFQQFHFIPFITKSESNSILQTENLRRKLVTDRNIRKTFGNISEVALDPDIYFEEVFGKKTWVANLAGGWQSMVIPRGAGQQVRGLNFGDYRPDCIVVDDFDDDKWLLNEELREWYHTTYFEGAVCKAVSQFESENVPYIISVSDTCKGELCLAEKLLATDSWEGLRISVCTEDYKTCDEDFMSQAQLDIEVAEAREHGRLDVFARELMSLPAAKEGKPFSTENFRWYDPLEQRFGLPCQHSFVMVDPARTLNMRSDFTAIVGCTVDFELPAIFVREVVSARIGQSDMIQQALDMCLRLDALYLGVEFAGLHIHIGEALQETMLRRGIMHIQVVDLKPQAGRGEQAGYERGKIARIQWSLEPWYKWRIVWHNPHCCGPLEHQLLMMPRPKKKDVADAFAYLGQLMHEVGMSFIDMKLKPEEPAGAEQPVPYHGTNPIEVAGYGVEPEPEPKQLENKRPEWDYDPNDTYSTEPSEWETLTTISVGESSYALPGPAWDWSD
jgi:hypothetical protein